MVLPLTGLRIIAPVISFLIPIPVYLTIGTIKYGLPSLSISKFALSNINVGYLSLKYLFKFSNNIAKKIVEYRQNKKIETTLELVEIIKTAVPMKFRIDKHPARQIFQAIRIEVNNELGVIEPAINQALDLLNVGGRVAVITFHSLEDRLVKNIFKEKCAIDPKLKGMPNIPAEYLPDFELVVNKAINPSEEEIKNNPRARSAKLRVIERIK